MVIVHSYVSFPDGTYHFLRPMFQAYISGNIPTKYGLKYGTVPPFLDPEIPIDQWIGYYRV